MYERYFNFSAEPFRLSPDHRFCYEHEMYAKARAYMAYAFMRAEGFVLITGPPGTGKTTLIGDVIESLADEHVAVANLVSTQLAADDLLRMVAFGFNVASESVDKAVLLQHLTAHFRDINRVGGRCLLIVDEAQDLSPAALEELRLLTNLQDNGNPLLQIFLVGQSEFLDLVHSREMQQVHQRIVAATQLKPIGPDETRAYVEHRLRAVGWLNDPSLSLAVFPIIYLFSEGVPRRINLFCSRLFLHCCVEQRHVVTVEDARLVVAELQEEQLATRNILDSELFHAEDEFEMVFFSDATPGTDAGVAHQAGMPGGEQPGSPPGGPEGDFPQAASAEAPEACKVSDPGPGPDPGPGKVAEECPPLVAREDHELSRRPSPDHVSTGKGSNAPDNADQPVARPWRWAVALLALFSLLAVSAALMYWNCDPKMPLCLWLDTAATELHDLVN